MSEPTSLLILSLPRSGSTALARAANTLLPGLTYPHDNVEITGDLSHRWYPYHSAEDFPGDWMTDPNRNPRIYRRLVDLLMRYHHGWILKDVGQQYMIRQYIQQMGQMGIQHFHILRMRRPLADTAHSIWRRRGLGPHATSPKEGPEGWIMQNASDGINLEDKQELIRSLYKVSLTGYMSLISADITDVYYDRFIWDADYLRGLLASWYDVDEKATYITSQFKQRREQTLRYRLTREWGEFDAWASRHMNVLLTDKANQLTYRTSRP